MTKKVIYLPIDWPDVKKVTGIRYGKLCKSSTFGWGVYNELDDGGPDFVEYKPPFDVGDECEGGIVEFVKIHEGQWEITIDTRRVE